MLNIPMNSIQIQSHTSRIQRILWKQKWIQWSHFVFAEFTIESTALSIIKLWDPNIKKNKIDRLRLFNGENETICSFLLFRFAVARRGNLKRQMAGENAGVVQVIILIVSLRQQKRIKHNSICCFQKRILEWSQSIEFTWFNIATKLFISSRQFHKNDWSSSFMLSPLYWISSVSAFSISYSHQSIGCAILRPSIRLVWSEGRGTDTRRPLPPGWYSEYPRFACFYLTFPFQIYIIVLLLFVDSTRFSTHHQNINSLAMWIRHGSQLEGHNAS